MSRLQDEANDVLDEYLAILRAQPFPYLRRLTLHKLVCEQVSPSGMKFAIEYWGAEEEKTGELRFEFDVCALQDFEWTDELASRWLIAGPDGSWETGPLE